MHDDKGVENAVRWAIASAEQSELPEHTRPTSTIFTRPESKASSNTKLPEHQTITTIDTIPTGYHKYAEPDNWTGGTHQEHTYKPITLTVVAVTNTAGQQHLQDHSHTFLAAWNAAKKTVKPVGKQS